MAARWDPLDPRSTLLDSVVANDHLKIRGLVVELARLPSTPGVVKMLASALADGLRVHLAVVEHVLMPELSTPEDEDLDRAAEIHSALRACLGSLSSSGPDLSTWVTDLQHTLADHIELEENVLLPSLHRRAGDRHLEALAFEYVELADTGIKTGRHR